MYQVISNSSVSELSKAVNDLIKQGWEALGGICVAQNIWGLPIFYQAMTRKKSDG